MKQIVFMAVMTFILSKQSSILANVVNNTIKPIFPNANNGNNNLYKIENDKKNYLKEKKRHYTLQEKISSTYHDVAEGLLVTLNTPIQFISKLFDKVKRGVFGYLEGKPNVKSKPNNHRNKVFMTDNNVDRSVYPIMKVNDVNKHGMVNQLNTTNTLDISSGSIEDENENKVLQNSIIK